ncbi:ATP-grasp domain-containing protein [Streptomyces sp. NPDC050095]|uniref:ATP-grasp domain-containing protein n=1 Tax=unclassified Streptomyces TaxID=2593676 RepID=UPI00343D3F4A
MPAPDTDRVVLVVAPGDAVFRRDCLEQVSAAYRTVVITPGPVTWEKHLVVDHAIADPADEAALFKAADALARRHRVIGVLTWNEWHLVPTARLAAHLGLPGNTPEAMRTCRNKALARAAFARHQVPSAAAVAVTTVREAQRAARAIGYPVVLKPAAQAASSGVIRATSEQHLADAYAFAAAATGRHARDDGTVLVEEYLDGDEVSVECVTHRGRTQAVAVTRKSLGPAPYFEEIGHLVDAADPLLAQVAPVAEAAVQALGITTGVQHVELRLTPTGPRLIEVNGRIGGDLISRLVREATGLDLPRIAADLALGKTPDLTATRRACAAVHLLYPSVSGTVIARHISVGYAEHTPWLKQVEWLRDIGDDVLLPPDGDMFTARAGYLLITARTAAQARARMDEALDQITLTVSPARPMATPALTGPSRCGDGTA